MAFSADVFCVCLDVYAYTSPRVALPAGTRARCRWHTRHRSECLPVDGYVWSVLCLGTKSADVCGLGAVLGWPLVQHGQLDVHRLSHRHRHGGAHHQLQPNPGRSPHLWYVHLLRLQRLAQRRNAPATGASAWVCRSCVATRTQQQQQTPCKASGLKRGLPFGRADSSTPQHTLLQKQATLDLD